MLTCTIRIGPYDVGSSGPRIVASNLADSCLSRTDTMAWFSRTAMPTAHLVDGVPVPQSAPRLSPTHHGADTGVVTRTQGRTGVPRRAGSRSVPLISGHQRHRNNLDIRIPAISTDAVATRLRRVEQVQRNREAVLAAARRVFLDKGYAGATLEAIADEAEIGRASCRERVSSVV